MGGFYFINVCIYFIKTTFSLSKITRTFNIQGCVRYSPIQMGMGIQWEGVSKRLICTVHMHTLKKDECKKHL